MFKRLKLIAKKLSQKPSPIDLSSFDDPVAEETDWFPLKGGGTNFKTHRLYKSDYNRYHFKATAGALLFAGIFATMGSLIPIFILIKSNLPILSVESLGILSFGLIFASVGCYMAYRYLRPIVFDKQSGYFWKGWKEPKMYGRDNPEDAIRLSEVHALQIIAEYVRSDKSSYYSYELNLILKDGRRFNVIDHGKLEQMRQDAAELSSFLGKPLWDLTDPAIR